MIQIAQIATGLPEIDITNTSDIYLSTYIIHSIIVCYLFHNSQKNQDHINCKTAIALDSNKSQSKNTTNAKLLYKFTVHMDLN